MASGGETVHRDRHFSRVLRLHPAKRAAHELSAAAFRLPGMPTLDIPGSLANAFTELAFQHFGRRVSALDVQLAAREVGEVLSHGGR